MKSLFCEGLLENDIDKLLAVPKSDIHNHSTKGCRRVWLEERLQRSFSKPPEKFDGLRGMQEWFTTTIKPYCMDSEGLFIRWEGAFAEAGRNNIKRLAMNFCASEIEFIGGIDVLQSIVSSFHMKYCPDTVFEPEITYAMSNRKLKK